MAEVLCRPLGRHLVLQHRQQRRMARDQADVGGVALVAAAPADFCARWTRGLSGRLCFNSARLWRGTERHASGGQSPGAPQSRDSGCSLELAVVILAAAGFSADGQRRHGRDRQAEARASRRWLANSRDLASDRSSEHHPGVPGRIGLSAVPFAAPAQGLLAKRQPSVMPSNRSRPRHKVSVPGSPSDLRPRNPPSLAIMRMASRRLGAGAFGGRFLFFVS